MPATLLPPNATPLEGHLEQAMAHYEDARAVPIDVLWDPRRCPAPLLPWLAWALAVRVWSADWDEDTQRQVVAEAIPLHGIEGTVAALRERLDAVGAIYSIEERPAPAHAPFTARITIFNSATVGAEATARLLALLDDVTRYSVLLAATLQAGVALDAPVAVGVEAVTVAPWRLVVNVP